MNYKKILCCSLSAFCVSGIFYTQSLNAQASGSFSVSADKTTAYAGDEVTFSVAVNGSFANYEYQLSTNSFEFSDGNFNSDLTATLENQGYSHVEIENGGHASGAVYKKGGQTFYYNGDLYTYKIKIPTNAKAGQVYTVNFAKANIDDVGVSSNSVSIIVADKQSSSSKADSSSRPNTSSSSKADSSSRQSSSSSKADSSSRQNSSSTDTSSLIGSSSSRPIQSSSVSGDSSSELQQLPPMRPSPEVNTNLGFVTDYTDVYAGQTVTFSSYLNCQDMQNIDYHIVTDNPDIVIKTIDKNRDFSKTVRAVSEVNVDLENDGIFSGAYYPKPSSGVNGITYKGTLYIYQITIPQNAEVGDFIKLDYSVRTINDVNASCTPLYLRVISPNPDENSSLPDFPSQDSSSTLESSSSYLPESSSISENSSDYLPESSSISENSSDYSPESSSVSENSSNYLPESSSISENSSNYLPESSSVSESSSSISADYAYSISADKMQVKAGDLVNISVNTDVNNINQLEYKLNTNGLTISRINLDDDFEVAISQYGSPLYYNDVFRMNFSNANISYNGAICSYTVRIPSNAKAGDSFTVGLSRAVINGIDAEYTPVTLTVEGTDISSSSHTDESDVSGSLDFIAGDVDNDKEISTADALTVLKKVVGLIDLDNLQTKAADVDKNGTIETTDALMILQKVVGLIKEF